MAATFFVIHVGMVNEIDQNEARRVQIFSENSPVIKYCSFDAVFLMRSSYYSILFHCIICERLNWDWPSSELGEECRRIMTDTSAKLQNALKFWVWVSAAAVL